MSCVVVVVVVVVDVVIVGDAGYKGFGSIIMCTSGTWTVPTINVSCTQGRWLL